MEQNKIDKFQWYQQTVQNVKKDVEFFRKQYKNRFLKPPSKFREDFCGTGLLSCEWAKNNVYNTAVGLDIDQPTLDWGNLHNVSELSGGKEKVNLINHNVLTEFDPNQKFDVICSLNFSHFLLKKRKDLLTYFKNVRVNIKKGLFIIDFYGGSHIYADHKHNNKDQNYVFKGKQMNILKNENICSLNYKVKKNKTVPFFNYDFRVYSLIELQEALEEANFEVSSIFIKEIFEDGEDDYTEYTEVHPEGEYYPESDRYNGYLISIVEGNN